MFCTVALARSTALHRQDRLYLITRDYHILNPGYNNDDLLDMAMRDLLDKACILDDITCTCLLTFRPSGPESNRTWSASTSVAELVIAFAEGDRVLLAPFPSLTIYGNIESAIRLD